MGTASASTNGWSNLVRNAVTEHFFNYPSALFDDNDNYNYSDNENENDKQQQQRGNQQQQQQHQQTTANQNHSGNANINTDSSSRKKTSSKRSISEHFFIFPTALFGDHPPPTAKTKAKTNTRTKTKTKPTRQAKSSPSSTRFQNQFFNFPSALFEQRQPPREQQQQQNDLRENANPQGHSDSCGMAANANENSNYKEEQHRSILSVARKRLSELEGEINGLQQQQQRSMIGNSNNSNNSTPVSKKAFSGAITQVCLRLDAIEIPRSTRSSISNSSTDMDAALVLRTKRKELLRRAEDLDSGSCPPSPSSLNSQEGGSIVDAPHEFESKRAHHQEQTRPQQQHPTTTIAVVTAAEDKLEAIEREIEALEGSLRLHTITNDTNNRSVDTNSNTIHYANKYANGHANLTTTNSPLGRSMVEELVTQLCCRLDGVDLPRCSGGAGPVGQEQEQYAAAALALKARRKCLLRRAQAIEDVAFRVEI